jgi:anaerobic C4-dicarboxylate transporter
MIIFFHEHATHGRRDEMKEKKRKRRKPSVAFWVTLLIGVAFMGFSGLESIGGYQSEPVKMDEAIGGLMQIVAFGLPFFIIAWILWLWPRVGGVVLLLTGLGFAVWMHFGWKNPNWGVALLLVGIPVMLGLITIIWPGKKVAPD